MMEEYKAPQVKDVCNRAVLGEGRDHQMGFAFCKEVSPGKFETVQPLSPCKDYLNDVVYSEATGKSFEAHGLKTKRQNIFKDGKAFMAISILPRRGGTWPLKEPIEVHKKQLVENHKNIQTLINHVEGQLITDTEDGKPIWTTIEQSHDPNIFLITLPLWWCQSTHLISLFSLLVRMAQFWDGKGEPDDFLDKYKNPLDHSLWNPGYGGGAYIKYKCMLKYGVKIICPAELDDRKYSIHDSGILNY